MSAMGAFANDDHVSNSADRHSRYDWFGQAGLGVLQSHTRKRWLLVQLRCPRIFFLSLGGPSLSNSAKGSSQVAIATYQGRSLGACEKLRFLDGTDECIGIVALQRDNPIRNLFLRRM